MIDRHEIDRYCNTLKWAIFPLKGNDKIPATKDGFKSATNNINEINKMLTNGHNLGVATGDVSGVFVLDIDTKNGSPGQESLNALIEEFGPLPQTAQVKTWSGGSHYYFKTEKGVGCKVGLRPGIDIRGNGGYVVAPPSTINNKPYQWVKRPHEVGVAMAPAWLIKMISAPTPQPTGQTDGSIADKIKENRNDSLMKMGAGLRKCGCNVDMITKHLLDVNANRCDPPLPEKEVIKIATSVSRYEVSTESKAPLTDVFNANYLTDMFGETILYCGALGGWYLWKVKLWEKDEAFEIVKLAQKALVEMRGESIRISSKEMWAHAVKSESRGKIEAMISLARANDVAVNASIFDKGEYIINCQNGTLDLRTGAVKKHDKNDFLTKVTRVDYNEGAECQRWLKFLDEIFLGDKELIRYVQKAIGYSLSGSVEEHCLFILYGVGRNGKSTFLKHIHNILGDYAMSTPASTLMEKYNDTIPNDVARLRGARFVSTVESGMNKSLSESTVKQLTGSDPITARFLHREYFDFFATFKIFMATNHKPLIRGTDKGIWSRIITIPFNVVIPPEEQDHKLDDKLRLEYEGIFRWAVEGFRLWQAEGLEMVQSIEEMKEEYRVSSDIIGQFIDENCLKGPGCSVSSDKLTIAMRTWAKENGYKLTRTDISNYLKEHGFEKDRASSGPDKGKMLWFGITIKDDSKYLQRGERYEQ